MNLHIITYINFRIITFTSNSKKIYSKIILHYFPLFNVFHPSKLHKMLFLDKIFDINILIGLHILRFFESKNYIFRDWTMLRTPSRVFFFQGFIFLNYTCNFVKKKHFCKKIFVEKIFIFCEKMEFRENFLIINLFAAEWVWYIRL